jgi:hypothetical protein
LRRDWQPRDLSPVWTCMWRLRLDALLKTFPHSVQAFFEESCLLESFGPIDSVPVDLCGVLHECEDEWRTS